MSPRSRTWRTDPTSQPARATRKRPGSTAQRSGRRSAGISSRTAGISRANRAGLGTASADPTGKPPPTSSVSKSGSPPRTKPMSARQRRTASRQASMAPSCEPTCRWIPRGRTRATPGGPLDGLGQLRLRHPELRRAGTDGQAGVRLGRHIGVRADEDVERRPAAVGAQAGRIGERDQPLQLIAQFDGHPRQWRPIDCGPDRGPQIGIGLADALQRDRVVRHACPSRDRPLAGRHDVRAQTAPGEPGHDRRDVVRLDRVAPMPRVREGVGERVGGGVERGDVGDERGRAEPLRGRSERRSEQRDAIRERCPGAGRTGRGRGRPYVT